jgi:serine phosphatase RsbU (regulator of sigma subunit)
MCLSLESLDGIWIFTDGLFEVLDGDGQEFGVAKICEALRSGDRNIDAIDRVVNAAVNFAAKKVFEDDLCVLGIDFGRRA